MPFPYRSKIRRVLNLLLPSADTRQADFGFDYHLPHEVRLNTSYSRKFSTNGNANISDMPLTYRFLFPVWRGHK